MAGAESERLSLRSLSIMRNTQVYSPSHFLKISNFLDQLGERTHLRCLSIDSVRLSNSLLLHLGSFEHLRILRILDWDDREDHWLARR